MSTQIQRQRHSWDSTKHGLSTDKNKKQARFGYGQKTIFKSPEKILLKFPQLTDPLYSIILKSCKVCRQSGFLSRALTSWIFISSNSTHKLNRVIKLRTFKCLGFKSKYTNLAHIFVWVRSSNWTKPKLIIKHIII